MGATRRKTATKPAAATEPEIKPGDLICARCGAGNDPARRFCRRCGNSLAMAVVAKRPPWYRRIFGRQRAVAAGERPREMGRRGRSIGSILKPLIAIALVLAALAAIFGYAAVPGIRQQVDSLVNDLRRQFMAELDDIYPISALPADGDHAAALAADDDKATYWLADSAAGPPVLTVVFAEPFDLGGLVFHSGSATDSDFTRHRRPRSIQFSFPGSSAETQTFDLQDDSAPQMRPANARGVRRIEIRLLATYPTGAGGDELIALREIEFKARR